MNAFRANIGPPQPLAGVYLRHAQRKMEAWWARPLNSHAFRSSTPSAWLQCLAKQNCSFLFIFCMASVRLWYNLTTVTNSLFIFVFKHFELACQHYKVTLHEFLYVMDRTPSVRTGAVVQFLPQIGP